MPLLSLFRSTLSPGLAADPPHMIADALAAVLEHSTSSLCVPCLGPCKGSAMSVGGRLLGEVNNLRNAQPLSPTGHRNLQRAVPKGAWNPVCVSYILSPLVSNTLEIHHGGQGLKGLWGPSQSPEISSPKICWSYVKSFRVPEKKIVGWEASKV